MYHYYDTIPKNADNIDKLISYYLSNNSKIDELNVTNELLKYRVASLMRNTFITSILTNTDINTFNMVNAYIKKDIKRGHENYKTAKDYYKYFLDELHKISPDITSITKIIQMCGYSYNTIAIELEFDLNERQYILYVPIIDNIGVEDIFHDGYINNHANEFQLFIRTSSCSSSRIWTGKDLAEIHFDEIDLTKYPLK